MIGNSETATLQGTPGANSPFGVLWTPRIEDHHKADLTFLYEFNRELNSGAQLSRLNEEYLEQRMEELDEHAPIYEEVYEHTRARLHELLLICAANYANNCEYGAVGDLMFNPRLTLVHIRDRHEPVVKERHTPLTEQFRDRAMTRSRVVHWLKKETALQIVKKPLVPHSYEILEGCGSISKEYMDSARARAVQIAEVSASLCCRRFEGRLDVDNWLRSASQSDRTLIESSLISLDWGRFRRLGELIRLVIHQLLNPETGAFRARN